ncbi:hypothetical protein, partial [Microcoleus sp. PH2017_01_SCD_O_A]|uniref:hypothetical protein n=1 Tax=Microcoleus sp. PH2017_01_SCD_O_A TaxID=2798812 RepID=UPI0025CF218D
TIINNLDKPALSPPTTYINLKFASHRKIVHDDCWLGWGGFIQIVYFRQLLLVNPPLRNHIL